MLHGIDHPLAEQRRARAGGREQHTQHRGRRRSSRAGELVVVTDGLGGGRRTVVVVRTADRGHGDGADAEESSRVARGSPPHDRRTDRIAPSGRRVLVRRTCGACAGVVLIGARPTLGRNEDEHRSCRSPGRDRRHGTRRARPVPGPLGGDRRVARRPVRRSARRTPPCTTGRTAGDRRLRARRVGAVQRPRPAARARVDGGSRGTVRVCHLVPVVGCRIEARSRRPHGQRSGRPRQERPRHRDRAAHRASDRRRRGAGGEGDRRRALQLDASTPSGGSASCSSGSANANSVPARSRTRSSPT